MYFWNIHKYCDKIILTNHYRTIQLITFLLNFARSVVIDYYYFIALHLLIIMHVKMRLQVTEFAGKLTFVL